MVRAANNGAARSHATRQLKSLRQQHRSDQHSEIATRHDEAKRVGNPPTGAENCARHRKQTGWYRTGADTVDDQRDHAGGAGAGERESATTPPLG